MSYTSQFPDVVRETPNSYRDTKAESLVKQQITQGRNIGTLVMAQAASDSGARVTWHGGYTAIAETGAYRALLRGHMCTDTAVSGLIVKDKLLTKQLLQQNRVSTPNGGLATTAYEAIRIQHELGGRPVVVKPRFGSQGKNVTVNITDTNDISQAFEKANSDQNGAIVEEYIDGTEFRLIATPSQCFGAVRRLLPHVIGDGTSTVEELILAKNSERRANPNNCKLMIPIDDITHRTLAARELSLSSILPQDAAVIVRNVGGISSGGDASECLDLLDESLKQLACDAIRAIPSMTWGGADILIDKSTGLPYLLEINTNAAISNSTYPVYGQPKDLGKAAWDNLTVHAKLDPPKKSSINLLDTQTPASETKEFCELQTDSESPARMTLMLEAYLRKNGWQTTRLSQRLLVAQHNEHKDEKWFNGLMDERFYASISSLLRHHRTVRSILKKSRIRVPAIKQVSSWGEARDYQDQLGTRLAIVRNNKDWSTHTFLTSTNHEAPTKTNHKWLVQHSLTGRRLTIFASRDRALLAISPERGRFSQQELNRAERIAINAIRSLPSLPWAAVDIVLTDQQRRLYVEGISTKTKISSADYIYAGSIGELLQEVSRGTA